MEVKLCDFGLAKSLTAVTHTSTVFSTPHYQAPEISVPVTQTQYVESLQVAGKEWTTAADIFSFGMLVFEIAMEVYPFYEIDNINEVRKKLQNGERPAIAEDCDKHFKYIIEWCWQNDKEKRPSINQVVHYINQLHSTYKFTSVTTPQGMKYLSLMTICISAIQFA